MSQKKKKLLRKQVEVKVDIAKGGSAKGFGIWEIIKENWKFLGVLIVGVTLIYINGIHGAFVSDDYATVAQNPLITSFSEAIKGWKLVYILNWLVAVTFGVVPWAYHGLSLAIFLVVCFSAFVFLYLVAGKKAAILASVIFAVLPIHVEAVTWISGKPYSLTTIFMLWVLIGWVKLLETGHKKYLALMAVSYLLAFSSDGARSLAIVFLLALYYVFRKNKEVKIDLWKFVGIGSLVLVAAVIFLWPAIIVRINSVNSGYNLSDSLFYSPFFQYPTSVAKYLQLMLVPVDLTLYHTMYIIPVWLNWVIFITYLATVIYFWNRKKLISFSLLFIFLASAASMAPIKVGWLVAERYMFFGSLGFALFLAVIFEELIEKNRLAALSVLSLLVSVYAVRTVVRNNDWNTNHNLWVNTVQVSPNSHNAWNNIGDDYDKLGQYENSIKGFTQSTVVKPNYADAYHNRANIFFKIGRLDLARDSYYTALKYSPALYQTYISLTQIDIMEKRIDLAIEHSEAALKLQPYNPQTLFVRGVVYFQSGELDKAEISFKRALEISPNFKAANDALINLAAVKNKQQ